jgi:hypothetical protein
MVICNDRKGIEIMDKTGEHHVARIDDTVTSANLHERAEAVAVPDFDYLEQAIEGVAAGLRRHHHHRGRHRVQETPETGDQR